MTEVLSKLIDDIRLNTAALDARDTRIIVLIREAEVLLHGLCKIRVQVPFGKNKLVWGKLDGAWRLLFLADGSEQEVALASCSRMNRYEAMSGNYIQAILLQMREDLEEQAKDRDFAIGQTEELLGRLKSYTGLG